ncbi:MAG: heme ABC exporter ATP-binding protein CcmA [Alphaproteobacteria bacterium]|nr:heme ABC exporter ATP-binding protein CcmA [Alphaproteobacteria bacterium]
MLTASNLTCMRSDRIIFENLGFSLQEGSLLLLKGGNGAGKTTLIEALAGKVRPDKGEILWKNAPIQDNAEFAREIMHIGHKSDIREDLTAVENLQLWGEIYDTKMLIAAALHFYDLDAYENIKVGELSVGLQRRVALSKLMFAPGKLWLLDEPTNFLDEDAILLTTSLIESRVQQGGIVIVATHIMNSAVGSHTLSLGDFVPEISA